MTGESANRAGPKGVRAVADNEKAADPDSRSEAADPAMRRAQRQAEREARRAANQSVREAARAERRAARAARGQADPQAQVAPEARTPHEGQIFDILIVGQGGGLDRQAAILAASLRRNAPDFPGRLIVAEPLPQDAWAGVDTRIGGQARAALETFGAEIRPFAARHFGRSYPYGNKIEALAVLDSDRPFLFLDSDTLVTGDIGRMPFDFTRPSASMRREGTWPNPPLYGPGLDTIWRSLYDRFGLEMEGSLDLSWPEDHWERYLYFNAGWFFGTDPAGFGRRFLDWARAVRDDPGDALACQSLNPWLDQVVLPLVIHSLGGGRPGPELAGLDGDVTTHYRNLPLLYARGPGRAIAEMEAVAALPQIAPLMQGWTPAERLIGLGIGRQRIAPMFADEPPMKEKALRQRLRAADLWLV